MMRRLCAPPKFTMIVRASGAAGGRPRGANRRWGAMAKKGKAAKGMGKGGKKGMGGKKGGKGGAAKSKD
jgi:hypothetical protein